MGILQRLCSEWEYFGEQFSTKVEYISDKFWSSVMPCSESLWKPELISPFIGRTLKGTQLGKDKAMLYNLTVAEMNEDNIPGVKGTLVVIEKNTVISVFSNEFVKGGIVKYEAPSSYRLDNTFDLNEVAVKDIILMHLFKEYADIQVVRSKPYKKVRSEDCGSILVESATLVDVIDCKWITTIVRGEGFKIRGHFRLQPYKVGGEWSKKLIYINEFEKHGYTRRAEKLVEIEKGNYKPVSI